MVEQLMELMTEEELKEVAESSDVSSGPKEVEQALFFMEGDCYYGIVTRIEIGRLMDFIPSKPRNVDDETWERRKHRLAYRFTIVIPEYDIEGHDIIMVSMASNSRMNELARCYRGGLRRGAKVYVCVKDGRLKISCPPVETPVRTQ